MALFNELRDIYVEDDLILDARVLTVDFKVIVKCFAWL